MGTRLSAVLQSATIADVLRMAKLDPPKARRLMRCPLPGHIDGTPSFSVLQASRGGRGYRCHGCGGHGGVLDLAVALELAKSRAAAVDYLGEHYRIPADADGGDYRALLAAKRRERALADFRYVPTSGPTEADIDDRNKSTAYFRQHARGLIPILDGRAAAGADYLRRRGIALDVAESAPVRYSSRWDRRPAVVFPIRGRGGRIQAGQGRHFDAADPKAHTIGPKADGIFALPGTLDSDVLAIVEAPLCALSFAMCGLPAIAILGTSYAEWLPIVLAYRRRFVAIATNDDKAGNGAAEKILPALVRLGVKVERLLIPGGAKDPNEMLQRDPDALLALATDVCRRGNEAL